VAKPSRQRQQATLIRTSSDTNAPPLPSCLPSRPSSAFFFGLTVRRLEEVSPTAEAEGAGRRGAEGTRSGQRVAECVEGQPPQGASAVSAHRLK
jgi:hypothetical protein